MLLGFVGIVIDVGRLYVTQRHLQTATDAAALAAAQDLPNGTTALATVCTYSATAATGNCPATDNSGGYIPCRCRRQQLELEPRHRLDEGNTRVPLQDLRRGELPDRHRLPTSVLPALLALPTDVAGCNAIKVTETTDRAADRHADPRARQHDGQRQFDRKPRRRKLQTARHRGRSRPYDLDEPRLHRRHRAGNIHYAHEVRLCEIRRPPASRGAGTLPDDAFVVRHRRHRKRRCRAARPGRDDGPPGGRPADFEHEHDNRQRDRLLPEHRRERPHPQHDGGRLPDGALVERLQADGRHVPEERDDPQRQLRPRQVGVVGEMSGRHLPRQQRIRCRILDRRGRNDGGQQQWDRRRPEHRNERQQGFPVAKRDQLRHTATVRQPGNGRYHARDSQVVQQRDVVSHHRWPECRIGLPHPGELDHDDRRRADSRPG